MGLLAETSSIIFGFFTHLVETGILKEGHWPAVHVYSLSRVWPQSWARELRFKTETLDLGLVLTLMCTQGHKNGFQVEEPVWNLAQVFVPSVKIQEWSSATKKKKKFLISVLSISWSLIQSEIVEDCQVLQAHLFSCKIQGIRNIWKCIKKNCYQDIISLVIEGHLKSAGSLNQAGRLLRYFC